MEPAEYQRLIKHPAVFSQGALEMSFKLLRKSHPATALLLQNCMAGKAIVSPFKALGQKEVHYFQLTLNDDDIQRVIKAIEAKLAAAPSDGQQIVLSALLNDWLNYAAWQGALSEQAPL